MLYRDLSILMVPLFYLSLHYILLLLVFLFISFFFILYYVIFLCPALGKLFFWKVLYKNILLTFPVDNLAPDKPPWTKYNDYQLPSLVIVLIDKPQVTETMHLGWQQGGLFLNRVKLWSVWYLSHPAENLTDGSKVFTLTICTFFYLIYNLNIHWGTFKSAMQSLLSGLHSHFLCQETVQLMVNNIFCHWMQLWFFPICKQASVQV